MSPSPVQEWWYFLCAVAAANSIAWILSAAAFDRRRLLMPADLRAARRLQLWLSAVYVAGCAFRSVFPVYDVPRICMVDSWISGALVGRSVATVAELCFAAQWALILRETARASGSGFARRVALALVPLIVIAEVCSWYSVLTTSNLGHVAEESLWGLCATLLASSVAVIMLRCPARRRAVLIACTVAGAAYAAYLFLVDVPMYAARWLADEAAGRRYLTLAQGLVDVANRRVLSHRWLDWQHEVVWMSLYFTVGPWISISLIHAPPVAAVLDGNRKRAPALAVSVQP